MAPTIYTSILPSVPIVRTSIFTHLFHSNADSTTIGGFPSSVPAFVDAASGAALSRGQLKHLALSLAFGLRDHPATLARRGDTVLIYSQNSLRWPLVLFGSIAAGLRCTLANSAYTSKELAFQYIDSGAGLVFSSEEGLSTVRQMFQELGVNAQEADKRIIVLGSGLAWAGGPDAALIPEATGLLKMEDLLQRGTLREEEKFDGKLADETVYLCYSSGTTGKPKGVETTHHNLTSVVNIVQACFPKLVSGQDHMLGILPFYHIYGAVKLILFPFTLGVSVVIQTRFEPVQFCANVEKYKVSIVLIVPPVLVVLSRHEAVDRYDMSSLTALFSGAAPLGSVLVNQVTERFLSKRKNNSPFSVLQGYGLTETSPTTHILPTPDALRKVGSIGILLPNLEARLLIDGDGDGNIEAKEGQPGELWMRGPTIMKGYLNNPSATKEAITSDGWFKTGDIAIRDTDGYYWIVDRRKELIKYKGFQVPPAELESVLLSHPDIADAAVIGVNSVKEATELPRAYVVHARPDEVKTESQKLLCSENIQKWMESKVARHKFIRGGVIIVDIIPKSAAGKILRRELRERAIKELAGRDPGGRERTVKL